MRSLRPLLLALVTLSASGCQIYFGGGDDDCVPDTRPLPAPTGLRNPQSGQCDYSLGGGGGGGCLPTPAAGADLAPGALPDWATCESSCTGLDEQSCQRADGCRAVYNDWCSIAALDCNPKEYTACWATAPSGPVRGGGCASLDAQTCSQHDDCVAIHQPYCDSTGSCLGSPGWFLACDDESSQPPPACTTLAEPGCIARADCAPLYRGSDCSCDPSGCRCNQESFVSCSDRGNGGGGACGPYTCSGGQYCQHSFGGPPPGQEWYECKPMPDACLLDPTLPTCSCLQPQSGCQRCEQDATTGAFTVTCLLP